MSDRAEKYFNEQGYDNYTWLKPVAETAEFYATKEKKELLESKMEKLRKITETCENESVRNGVLIALEVLKEE